MQIQQNKIKNLKLLYLQYKYKYICNTILDLTQHINFLENEYLIDSHKKNIVFSILYDINKNLNLSNNTYLITILKEHTNIDNIFSLLIESFDVNDLVLDNMMPFFKLIDKQFMPFYKEECELKEIVKDFGLLDLLSTFKFLFNTMPDKITDLLLEFNKVFKPISIKFFNIDIETINNELIYWRIPKIFNENDNLEGVRELWIKNNNIIDNNKNFIKIEGIFINDILSMHIKTCQVNFNYLYKKKKEIINEITNINEFNLNIEFIKRFMKFDYLGNIYCMKVEEYIDYISTSLNFFNQLCKTPFINIIKNFITNGTKLNKLYFIIFLLLLGTDDNNDVASLLLGVIKEKKINASNIYNLIIKKLPFFMQLKLKQSNNNIKNELLKIKTLTLEDIDYKKQLISNKIIPNNIKTITLEKIDEMKSQNNEYYKQKNFVEHILKYPWSTSTNLFQHIKKENRIQYLENIKNNLNSLTFGHEEVKDILLQTIASWITNPTSGGRPIGFVGPPGVGKTLLAQSISKALDIPFAEITLGGQNDGELLHGHGYTYSGSQPGLIIKKMVDMGKERCILYFDELDKTASKHGNVNEITSILIHLTDPNMNKTFQDRFFQGIDFPLDKVIMIFSYNDSDKIDPILLDRLTEIKIKPYTINDKLIIIRNFVIPELKKNIGIESSWANLSDIIIKYIIENYTNEAGIRNIKRKIEKIFLTLNLEKLLNKFDEEKYVITIDEVTRILLKPQSNIIKIHNSPCVGVINGLYATTNGDGGIIPIQIFDNFTSTKFEIKLTGSQGDVMKESVHCSLTCALEYIKQNLHKYNINDLDKYIQTNFKTGFHVHCPSTSTPKDGPSAGCAFTCCFISKILNKEIKNNIGMTGEIDLMGSITKIGGLNYKLIGAKKAGIKIVYVPFENKEDIDDIILKNKTLIDDNFQVEFVSNINEIIDKILL